MTAMKRNITNIKSLMTFCLAAGLTSCMLLTTQSCSENLDEGDFAIAKEQTISDYLADNAEYSKILSLFERVSLGHKEGASSLRAVLSARGNYTLFAPTNDALDKYIANVLGEGKSVENLDDEQAELVAYSCIIDNGSEQAYESPNFPQEGGAFTKTDLNDRTITCEERADEGSDVTYYYINGKCKVLKTDVRLSNGYLHSLDDVIAPSNENVPDLIKAADNMHIMGALLHYTGWDEKLNDFIDMEYEKEEREQVANFTVSNSDRHTIYIPQHRYLGYTGLIETDDVYVQNQVPAPQGWNIDEGGTLSNWNEVLDAIKQIAENAYGTSGSDKPITHEDNPVNRFVAYHFIEGKLAHNKFVQHMNEHSYKYGDLLNPQQTDYGIDIWDYYTTVGSRKSLIKVVQDAKTKEVFANRVSNYDVDGEYANLGLKDAKYPGVKIDPINDVYDNNARNGFYFPIDRILVLDEGYKNLLGGERIRIDVLTMLPEMINAGVRNSTYMYFDNDFFENITGCADDTKLLYLSGSYAGGVWCDLNNDEFMVQGVYDFTLKLPPVPKTGTYELRMGVSQNNLRGMCQIYFGDSPTSLLPVGLPYDMRNQNTQNDENVAWFSDNNLDAGSIIEKDKNMRNHGYMKAPKFFDYNSNPARDYSGHVRRIITTQNLEEGKSYYIRFKSCLEDPTSQFFSDYFEFCPRSVYNGIEVEDKW